MHKRHSAIRLTLVSTLFCALAPQAFGVGKSYELQSSKPSNFSRLIIPAGNIQKIFVDSKPVASSLMVQYLDNGVVKEARLDAEAKLPFTDGSARLQKKAEELLAEVNKIKQKHNPAAPILFTDLPLEKNPENVVAQVEPNWEAVATQCQTPTLREPSSEPIILTSPKIHPQQNQ